MKEGKILINLIIVNIMLNSCAIHNKQRALEVNRPQLEVGLVKDNRWERGYPSGGQEKITENSTLIINDLDGKEVILMKALEDETTGEMIAVDQIEAATIKASFRNIAERNGEVELGFELTVPHDMQDPFWQSRFTPKIRLNEDSLNLDKVFITGSEYRNAQLKGYNLYNQYISTIIPDTANFINYFTYRHQLDLFIKRNLPELATLKNDSTVVEREKELYLTSNIPYREAIEHYTKRWLVKANNRRKARTAKMFERYVKAPLFLQGIKLDTIIHRTDSSLTYCYVQRIPVVPNLRKIELTLSGEIYKEGECIYIMEQSAPLTFFVSSISTLADDTPRYLKRVIERNKESHISANIDFRSGRWEFDPNLGDNHTEIEKIKEEISKITLDNRFEVDSIVITASCSPEGKYEKNRTLADKRGRSIEAHFLEWKSEEESEDVWYMNGAEEDRNPYWLNRNSFRIRSIPEEWDYFIELIKKDIILNEEEKREIFNIINENEPDKREALLSSRESYHYIYRTIYPHLRRVIFGLHTHIKGMIKDTIHTNILDEKYMSGIQAIKERDYKNAIELLRDYEDYNTAVVYTSLNLNYSALQILDALPHSPKRDYLLAIAQARLGNEEAAAKSLIDAIKQDNSMIHRGNLDPEVSELIHKYCIHDFLENNTHYNNY